MNTKETKEFQILLRRNILFPLLLSLATGATVVGLVLFLIGSNSAVDHSHQVISEARQLLRMSVDSETGLRGYLLTGEDLYLEPQIKASTQMDSRLKNLRALVSDNPNQLQQVDAIKLKVSVWNKYFEETRLARELKKPYATTSVSRLGKSLMDDLRDEFEKFIRTEDSLRIQRTDNTNQRARYILALILMVSTGVGALLAVLGRRQLLSLAMQFKSNLQKQKEQTVEIEKQSWIQSSYAKLSDELRGNLSVSEICERTVSFLSKYVGAEVGRVFVANEASQFEANGSFAFDARKSTSFDTYSLNEGLIGQCASEGHTLHLRDVPADYLKISSGLGEMNISELLVVPATFDGTVKAVIELGFRRTPTPVEIFVAEQGGVRAAHAINSAQYRRQALDLLEETQRQSEELQAQQEELESNNEDLQQKSHELLAQQHNLEQANSELEQQQTVLEEQKERLEHAVRDLKLAQAESQEKAKGLEVANRYKSEFLANMSHELRTPLNSILLLSNLLSENTKESLDKVDIEYATTIHSSASDLLNLINDILDLSKVEAGKLDISPERTSVREVAETMLRMFSPHFDKNGIEFKIEIDPNAPSHITTDKVRCEQILRNFLSNASKFTERGSVTLHFFRPTTETDRYSLGITVKDTGIGISRDKHHLIFEAFKQADGTISRKFGGTGLGLTISRELSYLLAGKISVTSEEGQGSAFTLYLPSTLTVATDEMERVGSAPSPSPANEDVEKLPTHLAHGIEDDRHQLQAGDRTLLIIEDDPRFARQLFELGKRKGFKCLLSDEGETGLSDAARFQPLAIVLDLNLPGISGLAVLERLKHNPVTRHIPVHVVSVEERSKDVLHRGAAGFAPKPVTEKGLNLLIDKVITESQKSTKRILLIEDNLVEQQNVRQLIGNGDIEITSRATGKEALEELEKQSFDCIILDLKLPDLSGFEILARAQEQGKRLPPVIIYTARDLTKEEKNRLTEYSNSIVLKGARSPERLLDEVTLFLHQMEDTLSPSQKDLLQKVRHREEIFQDKKILLVDDDMRNIFALRSVLLRKGFQIHIAKTGHEALSRLNEVPDIHVVLMDVMMPEMDGYEAMKRIRQDGRFKTLPIIALTAKAMRGDREKCVEAGANDYLPKPVDMNSLLSLLRIWLTR